MSFEFKNCNKCGLQPIVLFSKRKDTKDGFSYTCKNCAKSHSIKYRKTYKFNHDECRNRNRIFVNKKKFNSCADCGIQYEPYCMDFDHILGTKVGNISSMVHVPVSIETLQNEISKCDLVCVLCHRDRTYSRNLKNLNLNLNKWTILNRQIVIDAKSKPCSICGSSYDHWKMDFDHIKKKNFGIASLMNGKRHYVKRLKEEISKCQLLCALCHRRKTMLEHGANHVI